MPSTPPRPPKDRRKTLSNQVVVVEARWGPLVWAWFLDTLVLWAIVVTTFAVVLSSTGEGGTAAFAALVAWPVGAFCYGLTTAYHRSLGQLAAGTRTLRYADGTVPGFWRAGWVMLVRVALLPALVVVLVLGEGPGDGEASHLSVDVRETEALWAAQGGPLQYQGLPR